MSDLQEKFAVAAAQALQLPGRPDNATLLQLYAFYKQATTGDVLGKRPGLADFAGRAKHDAWARLQGLSKEDAMQKYIDLVDRLRA